MKRWRFTFVLHSNLVCVSASTPCTKLLCSSVIYSPWSVISKTTTAVQSQGQRRSKPVAQSRSRPSEAESRGSAHRRRRHSVTRARSTCAPAQQQRTSLCAQREPVKLVIFKHVRARSVATARNSAMNASSRCKSCLVSLQV